MKSIFKIIASMTLGISMVIGQTGAIKVKAEGKKIVVYAPQPTNLNDKINKAFTSKTGIEVVSFTGTSGEIIAKLDAQKNNPEVDVIILSSWLDGLVISKTGALVSADIKNSDKLNKGFIDEGKTLFGYAASAYGIAYNTEKYSKFAFELNDLLKPEYNESIEIADPLKSASSKEFLGYYLSKVGEDAYKKNVSQLLKNGLFVDSSHKAALEKLGNGAYPILIGAIDYNVYAQKAEGKKVDMYYPKDSTIINIRPAMIPQTSKNQNEAKQYIEFLLSEEGQKIVAEEFMIPAVVGTKVTNRLELDKIPQNPIDYEKIKDFDDKAIKIYGDLKAAMKENN